MFEPYERSENDAKWQISLCKTTAASPISIYPSTGCWRLDKREAEGIIGVEALENRKQSERRQFRAREGDR
jgi:hypothetical protein